MFFVSLLKMTRWCSLYSLEIIKLTTVYVCCILIFSKNFVLTSNDLEHVVEEADEGCQVCAQHRCPTDTDRNCLLGSLPDPCDCCPSGLCARVEGEPCWNASLPGLPKNFKKSGYCGENYACVLRTDLEPEDPPESICVCINPTPVCGVNNRTYATACALEEESKQLKRISRAIRRDLSSLNIQHEGACLEAPKIHSTSGDLFRASLGERVVLSCEVKGNPVPNVFWEFKSDNTTQFVRLPAKDRDAYVTSSEGPEDLMRSSWVQLSKLENHHYGLYHCIANNSMGQAYASMKVVAFD